MLNLRRRLLVLGVAAVVPMAVAPVVASAEISNPGVSLSGLSGSPCLAVQSGTVVVDGPGGILVVNGSGVAVQGLSCWL